MYQGFENGYNLANHQTPQVNPHSMKSRKVKAETEEEVSAFGRAPYCSVEGSSSHSDPSAAESCWLL